MEITLATIYDAPPMYELTENCIVMRGSNRPGFVEYSMPDLIHYEQRIAQSKHSVVATLEGKVLGLIAAFDSEQLGRTHYRDPIVEQLNTDEPFVYIEHIAVHPEHRKQKIASAMLDKVLETVSGVPIKSAVAHSPVRNAASIELLKKKGFSWVDEKYFQGITFGIYRK